MKFTNFLTAVIIGLALLFIFLVMFGGCDNAPVSPAPGIESAGAPIATNDFPIISITDYSDNTQNYFFKSISQDFISGYVNISFPEGCGVTVLMKDIKTINITTQINKK